ncbi:hypothetical protein [Bradyrhizobium sp. ARR65]|uniref:hypothetical protein n=1 Tax=Bradyrhizobium sp. ARR65 TaxID=1040989 RepID=UPI0004656C16|nr:hypothetical protein [Bradyrhizobium sp. ARR65]
MAPDRQRELERLSEVDRYIAEAEVAIKMQIANLDELRRDGRDTSAAEEMLRSFERSLRTMRAHREEIISTIDKIDNG